MGPTHSRFRFFLGCRKMGYINAVRMWPWKVKRSAHDCQTTTWDIGEEQA